MYQIFSKSTKNVQCIKKNSESIELLFVYIFNISFYIRFLLSKILCIWQLERMISMKVRSLLEHYCNSSYLF